MLRVAQKRKLYNRFMARQGNRKSPSDTRGGSMSQNTFDRFTVLFTNGKIFLGENSFPLGHLTVDFLNLDERVLDKIEERVNSFLPTMQILLGEKTDNFLYTEFYRGLIAGNMPRKCHNCGRYLLLTKGNRKLIT